jgi:hypothetical protein
VYIKIEAGNKTKWSNNMVTALKEKSPARRSTISFAACFEGQTIATAKNLEVLLNRKAVKKLIGNKGLFIKHVIPEGVIAIY